MQYKNTAFSFLFTGLAIVIVTGFYLTTRNSSQGTMRITGFVLQELS